MKRYEKYKPTGIQWLPEIPEHWKVQRFGSLFKRKVVANDPSKELLSVFLDRGVIKASESDKRTHQASDDLSKYQLVEPTDFVMNNQQAWRGSVGVSNFIGIISPAYHLFAMPSCYNPHYANYLLRDRVMVNLYDMSSKGVGSIQRTLNFNWLNNGKCILPSITEQNKIVAYLNKRITLIDNCKCQRERELQTLNELKQAEIASVVTRGLNPDVPMKDSGIPWIGQIPSHWETMRIRGLFKESDEKTVDESGTLLSLSQYSGITRKADAGKTGMFEAESTIGYKIVHPGQFVMNIMLAWNGSYAVSDLEGIISPAYCVFDFRLDCNKKYYDYLLRTKAYCGAFKTQSRGIIDSRLRLYPYKFYAFKTLVPPIEEQNAIVEYIESKTNKIDTMIEALKAEIDRLTEYKQRLISDVVTGQIDVRGEQIQ